MQCLGHEQLSAVQLAASIELQSIPDGADVVWLQADGDNVRMRGDGVAVTATTGIALYNAAAHTEYRGKLSDLRFILEANTPALNVMYFGA